MVGHLSDNKEMSEGGKGSRNVALPIRKKKQIHEKGDR